MTRKWMAPLFALLLTGAVLAAEPVPVSAGAPVTDARRAPLVRRDDLRMVFGLQALAAVGLTACGVLRAGARERRREPPETEGAPEPDVDH